MSQQTHTPASAKPISPATIASGPALRSARTVSARLTSIRPGTATQELRTSRVGGDQLRGAVELDRYRDERHQQRNQRPPVGVPLEIAPVVVSKGEVVRRDDCGEDEEHCDRLERLAIERAGSFLLIPRLRKHSTAILTPGCRD